MSFSTSSLVQAVKQAALTAVHAEKPMMHYVGEVTSIQPLKIRLGQNMYLTEAQLILSQAVQDGFVTLGMGPNDPAPQSYYITRSLRIGEQVLLLRGAGGQTFLVLDRVNGRGREG